MKDSLRFFLEIIIVVQCMDLQLNCVEGGVIYISRKNCFYKKLVGWYLIVSFQVMKCDIIGILVYWFQRILEGIIVGLDMSIFICRSDSGFFKLWILEKVQSIGQENKNMMGVILQQIIFDLSIGSIFLGVFRGNMWGILYY